MDQIIKSVVRMPGDVHVNANLTNVSIAYMQSARNFIADRVFPILPVAKQSDLVLGYSRADWNRDEMRQRAPGTEAATASFGTYELNYFAKVWALGHDIADATRANADSIFSMDRDTTNFLTMKAMIRKELLFASVALAPGIWANNRAGVAAAPVAGVSVLKWSEPASTPIEDIRTAKREVLGVTGFEPNKLTLSKDAYDILVDHPDIIDRVKYGQTPGSPAKVNEQALASVFELEEVIVSKAIRNSAKEGAAEQSAFINVGKALLTYTTPAPSVMMPSAGYTFSWNGWMGASPQGFRMKKFRVELRESDRVEVQAAFEQKVMGADLGFLFNDIV